jgi:hypothetical protein
MSDFSPLSGLKRKLDFGAVRSACDPKLTFNEVVVTPVGGLPLG